MFDTLKFEKKLQHLFDSKNPDQKFLDSLEQELIIEFSKQKFASSSTQLSKIKLWQKIAIGIVLFLFGMSVVFGPQTIIASILDFFRVYLPNIGFSEVSDKTGLQLDDDSIFIVDDVNINFSVFYSTNQKTMIELEFYQIPIYLNQYDSLDDAEFYSPISTNHPAISWVLNGESMQMFCQPSRAGIIGSKYNFDPKADFQNWRISYVCPPIPKEVESIVFKLNTLPLMERNQGPQNIQLELVLTPFDVTELDEVQVLDFEIIK